MARPTKYTEELVANAEKYLSSYTTLIPTIEGLALHLGISRETVYAWKDDEDKQQFSDIVDKILATQSAKLIEGGLSGEYNASITKLILSGKHGYVEKSNQDITTNGKDLPQPIMGGVSVQQDSSNK